MATNRATKSGFAAEAQRKVSNRQNLRIIIASSFDRYMNNITYRFV